LKSDITRSTFDPTKRYTGVRMQQGRVQLDAAAFVVPAPCGRLSEQSNLVKRQCSTKEQGYDRVQKFFLQ